MSAVARDLDVLCFGEIIVDFFPAGPGIAVRDADVFYRHAGGAPANMATGLARLGRRAGLMTLVGRDEFGAFLRRRLEEEGVDTAALGTHPSLRTGITFVAVSSAGERSFTFYRHPSADQAISEADVDPAQVARARVFHFGSSTLSREPARAATWKAVAAARAAGAIVSCDPNLRPHLWSDLDEARAQVRRAVAASDLVKVSDDELAPIVGTRDVDAGLAALRALGPALVVVTRGARGCVYDGVACGRGEAPGLEVPVVDTTGAGDGFVAGLLAQLAPAFAGGRRPGELTGDEVAAACAFANRVAARVVGRFGATAALPRTIDL
jgi:fructokinase